MQKHSNRHNVSRTAEQTDTGSQAVRARWLCAGTTAQFLLQAPQCRLSVATNVSSLLDSVCSHALCALWQAGHTHSPEPGPTDAKQTANSLTILTKSAPK
jgi:hypothetical protein